MVVEQLLLILARILTFLRIKLNKKETSIAYQNIQNVLKVREKNPFAETFVKQVYLQQFLTVFDTLIEAIFPGSVRFHGLSKLEENLNSAIDKVNGVVVATAHLGSWELVGLAVTRSTKRKQYALAKPLRYRWAHKLLTWVRGRFGVTLIWNKGISFQRKMLKVLQEGQCLTFVMDQKPEKRRGPIVKFYGREVAFVGGPAAVALKKRLPIVSVFCIRKCFLEYEVLTEILFNAEDCDKLDQQKLTQCLAQEIEQKIKLYPEQWCWSYKRWKL